MKKRCQKKRKLNDSSAIAIDNSQQHYKRIELLLKYIDNDDVPMLGLFIHACTYFQWHNSNIVVKETFLLRRAVQSGAYNVFLRLIDSGICSKYAMQKTYEALVASADDNVCRFLEYFLLSGRAIDLTGSNCQPLLHTIANGKENKFCAIVQACAQIDAHRREIIRCELLFQIFAKMHQDKLAQSRKGCLRRMAQKMIDFVLYNPSAPLFADDSSSNRSALTLAYKTGDAEFFATFEGHFLEHIGQSHKCIFVTLDLLANLKVGEQDELCRSFLQKVVAATRNVHGLHAKLLVRGTHLPVAFYDQLFAMCDDASKDDQILYSAVESSAIGCSHRVFAYLLRRAPSNVLMKQNSQIARQIASSRCSLNWRIVERLGAPCFVQNTFGYKSDFLCHYMLKSLCIVFMDTLPPYVVDLIASKHGYLRQYPHNQRMKTILAVYTSARRIKKIK